MKKIRVSSAIFFAAVHVRWWNFFDFGDARVRPNKKIDTKLSSVLFALLSQTPGSPTSLANP